MNALMDHDFAAALLGVLALLLVGWLWIRDERPRLLVKDGSGLWHRAREATIIREWPLGTTTRTAWTACGWCLPVQQVVATRSTAPLAEQVGEERARICDRCDL